MNKKAFTLIELLIVIVIIGILTALIAPVMGRAREGARRAMCANNLRQHGVAWYLYLDDHNDCFPKASLPPSDIQCDIITFGGKIGCGDGYENYTADMRPLNHYLDVNNTSSAEIFHCPDDTKEWTVNKTTFDYYGSSYTFNMGISFFGFFGNFIPRPLSTITAPHDKVMMEICSFANEPGHGGKLPNKSVMVLFLDGHVKGPYLYTNEFDMTYPGTQPEKPVYYYP